MNSDGFIFDWKKQGGSGLAMTGFFLLSICLHVAGFYLFKVVYPPTVSLRPPAASLTIQQSSAKDPMTGWTHADDPALVASHILTHSAFAESLLPVPYTPSYASAQARTLPPPESRERIQLPSSLQFESATRRYSPHAGTRENQGATAGVISARVAGEKMALPEDFFPIIDAKGSEPLKPAEILARVSGDGRIENLFVLRSSGARDVDGALIDNFRTRQQYLPEKLHGQWIFLEVSWGSGIYKENSNGHDRR